MIPQMKIQMKKKFILSGSVGAGKQLLGSCVVLRTCPRIFGEVAELARHSAEAEDKRGFYPILKGFGNIL